MSRRQAIILLIVLVSIPLSLLAWSVTHGKSSPDLVRGKVPSPPGSKASPPLASQKKNLVDNTSSTKSTPAKKLKLVKIGQFQSPVWMSQEPESGDLYIVEQEGRIVRKSGQGKSTWLDISDDVQSSGEQGLLSMAFSPGYQQNGLFYVYYTNNLGDQVIAEGRGDKQSGEITREVLRMKDFASNHNGGQITFGPGRLLYIATGDGGGGGDPKRTALNPRSLLGKILRILPYQKGDQPYTIPRDNPYFSAENKKREIFSSGLRNPWRFSFARGRIWIADVGQSEQEEVSAPRLARARGGNFGWSAREGRLPYNDDQKSKAKGAIPPVLVYGRDRGCSITGGYFVDRLGPLQNRYLYTDFCTGQIRSFRLVGGRAKGDRSEGLRLSQPVSFTRGSGGKIWVISLGGAIYRLR